MTPPPDPTPPETPRTTESDDHGVDLNDIVAYNVRARRLRGWTQKETARRLEPLLGRRLPQVSISHIERAYENTRHRDFDAHEPLAFALVFKVPLVWFFLPPPGDRRRLRRSGAHIDDLCGIVFGQPEHLEPLHERLRQLARDHPAGADLAIEQIAGGWAADRQRSYRERHNDMLVALLGTELDGLDKAADDLVALFDRLRHVGTRAVDDGEEDR